MLKRFSLLLLLGSSAATAQVTPWLTWTLLPDSVMAEIIGESSGESAWYTILETAGYDKDRTAREYDSLFHETEYFQGKMRSYGLSQIELSRFPGGTTWDAVSGDLWEMTPQRQKLSSYRDHAVMLASGSKNADVTAELIWVGSGRNADLEGKDITGKIVFTDGPISSAHARACIEHDAAGVLSMNSPRPLFDPIQLPWGHVSGNAARALEAKFGFLIPPREGEILKTRLLAGEQITVHAKVVTEMQPYTLQDLTCAIPGTDSTAGEIILSAHLFEGWVKQGANDNLSGSAAILEAARTLNTLIREGRIPPPVRTIRFIWAPEFSGTIPWVKQHPEIIDRMLCNINLDMVGEWLSKNLSFMTLLRTTYGNPHYVNDVAENYFRFVGEGNRERIQNRGGASLLLNRIVAPTGADEPFPYSIEVHYGASDHEVFNDWTVRVPGVMMIAWPDQWYHTSGDHADKSDPTQLRRAVVIAAATAYTIAIADVDMAQRIAAETFSNATRRLGHQLARGQEELNRATAASLPKSYKLAASFIETAVITETKTLKSIAELGPSVKPLGTFLKSSHERIAEIGSIMLKSLESHMQIVAKRLATTEASLELTAREREAARLVPRAMPKVRQLEFWGMNAILESLPADVKAKYPLTKAPALNRSELQLLVDGENSVLMIKKMLDAQSPEQSMLEEVLNYLRLLEAAGLVGF